MTKRALRVVIPFSFSLVMGCLDNWSPGGAGTAPGELPPGIDPATVDSAVSGLRHLTPRQYANTLRDLLALSESDAANLLLPTDENIAPSELLVTKLDAAAELAASLRAHHALVPCDVAGAGSDSCASDFIATFGAHAFRRPLTDEEITWLTASYAEAKKTLGFADSIDVVARVMFQAPQLFYIFEEGQAVSGLPDGLYRRTSAELATRLAYALWDSTPDDALLTAAAQGRLDSLDGIVAEAERMLADPRAETFVIRFFTELLELNGTAKHVGIEDAVKDPADYPIDSLGLRAAMRREIEELVRKTWKDDGTLSDLLTSTDAYVNGPLAQLYGVQAPAGNDTFAWVKLSPTERAGVITRAGLLMVYSHPDIPSPIRRGSLVQRKLLCRVFGAPPPDAANDQQIPAAAGSTLRDSVNAQTLSKPECAACHVTINPTGFTFGNYDAIGRWITTESGKAIDTSGELPGSDVAGKLSGAIELSTKLAESRQVSDCVASQWYEAMVGHKADPKEKASIAFVGERFASSKKLSDLVKAVVQSPSFIYLRRGQ